MTEVTAWPGPTWNPVARPGVVGVQTRLLNYAEGESLIAQLFFEANATIDEHDARYPIDVYCLEGRGFTSVSGEAAPIKAGQRVRWPAGAMHRLWTESETMVMLMHEHLAQTADPPNTP